MSTRSTLKEDHNSDIEKRSKQELLEEEIRNQKHWKALLNLIKTGANQNLFFKKLL